MARKRMNNQPDDFEIVPFPKVRRSISDMLREGQRKHMVHGLTEVDVTLPRQILQEHKARSGETMSFTGFIVTCVAHAVDENRIMQAYRRGTRQLVLFDEVDVNTQIERTVGAREWVMPYIIRAANKRTFREIHDEIRTAQVKEVKDAREYKQYEWYLLLPRFVRRLFWRALERSPHLTKRIAGTVGVTALGMFGQGSFWGIPITTQTLLVTVGGIAEGMRMIDGQPKARELLSLTISFDHDIIDGAPAVRFSQRLKELIESGYGLEE